MKKLLSIILGLFIFNSTIVFASFNSNCVYGEITMCAPSQIPLPGKKGSGKVAPISVELGTDLKAGDVLELYTDNNLTHTLSPAENVSISSFSVRIKATSQNTKVKVKINRQNGDSSTESRSFDVANPAELTSKITGGNKKKYKLRKKYQQFKFLIRSPMSTEDYISEVVFNTSNGDIVVNMTPYASTNPYIKIKGNVDNVAVGKITVYGE